MKCIKKTIKILQKKWKKKYEIQIEIIEYKLKL